MLKKIARSIGILCSIKSQRVESLGLITFTDYKRILNIDQDETFTAD